MFCYVLLCQLLAGPDFNLRRLLNGKHIPAPYSHHKSPHSWLPPTGNLSTRDSRKTPQEPLGRLISPPPCLRQTGSLAFSKALKALIQRFIQRFSEGLERSSTPLILAFLDVASVARRGQFRTFYRVFCDRPSKGLGSCATS